jgi:lipopolysaccharide export system permease protein
LKILDRYITTEFLKVFLLCLMGFVLVMLLVEMTDKIKLYFEENPSAWLMIKYFLVKIPGYTFYAIPLSILMAGMMSLLLMARHSEMIAMQANGIDALMVAKPVLLVGIASSVIMLLANETIIPWSNWYSEYIQEVEIRKKPQTAFFRSDEIWVRSPDCIVHVGKFDRDKLALDRLTIVRWDENYNFTLRIYADKAKWWKDQWILYGVNRTERTPDGRFHVEVLPSLTGALDTSPADFGRIDRLTKEMNLMQLSAYIDKLHEEGHAGTRYIVDWHDKIAFPFACLIMAALSVPFAIRVNPRGGGVAIGFAVSLVVAFSYWIAHALFIALGHGGYIPPIAAAWGANVIFGLSAFMLMLHSDT